MASTSTRTLPGLLLIPDEFYTFPSRVNLSIMEGSEKPKNFPFLFVIYHKIE
jgi:hypothetical protein